MARYRLGSICQIISGSTPKTGVQEYWNGDKKWITPAELSESDYIIYDTERKLTEAGVKSAGLTPLPKGTVILSSRAPIGKVAIAGCEMYCNQGFKNFVCSDIINNKYLYWYLRSKTDFLNSLGRGATFTEISKSTVADIELDIPKHSEQSKRVAHLEKLQSIIASRRIQLAKLDELVKCRFVELFGDQKTNPHKWPTARIGTCCTLKSGTSLPAEKENEGGPIPYVKVGDMNYSGNEHYLTTSSRFVSEHTAGAGIFPIGTVIFPKRGGAIGTNKKRLTLLPICADLNVMGVTAGAKLESLYLFAYFNSIDLGTLGGGSSIPQINNKDIAPLIICLPPMALQKQFTAFVSRIDKLRFVIQQSLDETQKLFDSLMQEYFD